MYHRFNENKYPSTNIKMDVFKKHIEFIQNSNFDFYNSTDFKKNHFKTIKLNYSKTDFFKQYELELKEIYDKKYKD